MGGMPAGRYKTGLGELEVLASGKLVPAGQPDILAGGSVPIHVCVANIMRFAGVDLATAIRMASLQPAKIIGLDHAGLQVGASAHLVLFDLPSAPDKPLNIRQTLIAGQA